METNRTIDHDRLGELEAQCAYARAESAALRARARAAVASSRHACARAQGTRGG
jgi:hypothetical protein